MKFNSRFVIFDTETTGLSSEKHGLLEVAMVVLDNDLNEIGEYQSLIKKYRDYEIAPQALAANGLTMDYVEKNGEDSKIVVKSITDILKNAKVPGRGGKPMMIGHNIDKFDIPFLDVFFDFHKKELGDLVNIDFTIDTMWWSRLRWQESENYKLGTCCRNAKIELIDAHRAMVDTRSTAELFKHFMRNLRNTSTQTDEVTPAAPVEKTRENFKFNY